MKYQIKLCNQCLILDWHYTNIYYINNDLCAYYNTSYNEVLPVTNTKSDVCINHTQSTINWLILFYKLNILYNKKKE